VVDVRAQAGVAAVAATAHGATVTLRSLAGIASAAMTGHATLTVSATVQAVAEAIHPPSVTLADLQALVVLLNDAVRAAVPTEEVAQQVEQQAPLFGPVGQFIRANDGLIALIALVAAVMAFLQDRANNARVEPPPSVTVHIELPDRAEVERIVEEKLREANAPAERSAK
jgi:hypothetical protein